MKASFLFFRIFSVSFFTFFLRFSYDLTFLLRLFYPLPTVLLIQIFTLFKLFSLFGFFLSSKLYFFKSSNKLSSFLFSLFSSLNSPIHFCLVIFNFFQTFNLQNFFHFYKFSFHLYLFLKVDFFSPYPKCSYFFLLILELFNHIFSKNFLLLSLFEALFSISLCPNKSEISSCLD